MKHQADTLMTGAAGLMTSGLASGSDLVFKAADLATASPDTIQMIVQIVIALATLLKMWNDSKRLKKEGE